MGGITFLLISLIFLGFFTISSKKIKHISREKTEYYLKFLLFSLIMLANLEYDEDMNKFVSLSMLILRISLVFSLIVSIFYMFNKHRQKIFFIVLLALLIISRLTVVRISKDPQVDVFDMLKYAPLSLLKGENPFEHPESVPGLEKDWQRPYLHFTYGPATLFYFLPFDLLFKDPRYFLILIELLSALLLFHLLSQKKLKNIKFIIPLIFLYYPLFTRMVKMAYLEPLIVFFFFLGFWLLDKKRFKTAFFAFGSAISVKWVYILFLPFLILFNPKRFLKNMFFLLIIILLFYWPFVEKNFPALFESTIMYSLRDHTRWLNLASLTVQTWFYRQFRYIPHLIFWVLPMILFLIPFFLNFKKNLSFFAAATAATLLVFFLFSPQGVMHYYYFVSSLILLAITFVLKEKNASHRA